MALRWACPAHDRRRNGLPIGKQTEQDLEKDLVTTFLCSLLIHK